MEKSPLDVIIIGAGYAGLSASYYLKQHGLEHVIFERGKPGESWRSKRWNSFKLNTPDRLNLLPADVYKGNNPEQFSSAEEFVSGIENYVSSFKLPVIENTAVVSVEKKDDLFHVTVSSNNVLRQYQSRQVIAASGSANEAKIPSIASSIPGNVKQLHTAEYRSASDLPDGAVLVAGGAQSGIQVAEDLADSGRKVYFATSMVGRVPRNYRGRDIHDWLIDLKFFDATKEQIKDPAMINMKPPHLTGAGDKARTISLQSLAGKGVIILGRIDNADDKTFTFQPSAPAHIKFADGLSLKVKAMIDEYIAKTGIAAPAPDVDMDDAPDIHASCASDLTSIAIKEHNIRSVIWATGFTGDFSYIKLPIKDNGGNLEHENGIAAVGGLYFIGLPWMRHRKSVILFGIREDAEFICRKVLERSATHYATQTT